LSERTAHADVRKDVQQKLREAMESYDVFEYEQARSTLNEALAAAKKAKLDKDPVVAQIHVRLGIVLFAGLRDASGARAAFRAATQIDPKVQIDAAYKTDEMQALLNEARGQTDATATAPASPAAPGDACSEVAGVEHTLIDTALAGKAVSVEAMIGEALGAAKVAVMYRAEGAVDFTELRMTKQSGCTYTAEIPGSVAKGALIHYYVAAYNKAGKVLASKGSAGSPNLIEIAGGGGATPPPNDGENPLAPGDRASVSKSIEVGTRKPMMYVSIAAGSGSTYVTGVTEQQGGKVRCCFVPSWLHVFPEVGFFLTRQTALAVAGRIGFPIGVNVDGHARVAPAGLFRLRHAFSDGGDGLQVTVSVGGGVLRSPIGLDENKVPGMDTDVAALGPLLAGAGAGYVAALGGSFKLSAELNALAGVPVVKQIGSSRRLNFGVQFDVNLGIIFGF